jgi:bacillithiol system protein YtxJ
MLLLNLEFRLTLINFIPFEELKEAHGLFIVFKHSPRCSISTMAKSRLERSTLSFGNTPFILVDVLAERALSNQLASQYAIEHQSPQILVISGGKCIYTASHQDINPADLKAVIQNENEPAE